MRGVTAMDVFSACDGAAPGAVATEPGVFIGGGQVEFDAIARARARLAAATAGDDVQRVQLGPSLGQCCGGVMYLRYERVGAADTQRLQTRLAAQFAPVALFGGGHVGRAIV